MPLWPCCLSYAAGCPASTDASRHVARPRRVFAPKGGCRGGFGAVSRRADLLWVVLGRFLGARTCCGWFWGGFSARLVRWLCAACARGTGILPASAKPGQEVTDAAQARFAQLRLGQAHLAPPDVTKLGQAAAVGEVLVSQDRASGLHDGTFGSVQQVAIDHSSRLVAAGVVAAQRREPTARAGAQLAVLSAALTAAVSAWASRGCLRR